ncbi:MAG: putative zinc-binding protein [Acidobacteria bacterium]|nr:putative zinc-binding protein [Acidobacteriota bacterium]
MSEETTCACSAAPKLIFACSGAADVGALADQVARKLSREGAGNMFCLAGIGGRVSGIVKSTEVAAKILAIDGCSLSCTRECLKNAGFSNFEHIQLADLEMKKGSTPMTDENIAKVYSISLDKLAPSL